MNQLTANLQSKLIVVTQMIKLIAPTAKALMVDYSTDDDGDYDIGYQLFTSDDSNPESRIEEVENYEMDKLVDSFTIDFLNEEYPFCQEDCGSYGILEIGITALSLICEHNKRIITQTTTKEKWKPIFQNN